MLLLNRDPETCLGWAPIPPREMAEQIDHLAASTYRRIVRLGILPWGQDTAGVIPLHSWHLFDRRFVVVGFTHGAFDLEQAVDVRPYIALADRLEQLAVFDDDARTILARVADRYREL